MNTLRRLVAMWRTLRRRDQLDQDTAAEVQAYLELLTDEGIARGLSPAAARRRALVKTEGATQVREVVRESRPGAWIAHAAYDLRYAWRSLRRSPPFTFSAVITLALAIGATTAIIRVIDVVVRAPLPFPDATRLVAISGHGYVGEYVQFRARAQTMDVASYLTVAPMTLTGAGDPVRLETRVVSHDLFGVLGATFLAGGTFTAGDGVSGGPPAIVMSERVWRQRYSADPAVIGTTVTLNGVARQVRGVLASASVFPSATVEMWVAARIDPGNRIAIWSTGGALIGRLRSGSTLDQARAEIRSLGPSFRDLFPWKMPSSYGTDADVRTLKDELVGDHEATLLVAGGAVAFVLVLACLNVGILLTGRSLARHVELTTRATLGATRGRLSRQVMVECALLAALGGGAGITLAAVGLSSFVQLLPADIPRLHEVSASTSVLAIGGVLTCIAALFIGAVPTWRAARPTVVPSPAVRHPGQDRAARRTTRTLVVVEVALAMVLIVGAGLLVRTLNRVMSVAPGFDASSVVSATMAVSPTRYAEAEPRRAAVINALEQVAALPFVRSAAVTDQLPFGGAPFGSVFIIQGQPDPAATSGEWPWADVRATVSPAFFETLQIPVRAGRAFADTDRTGAPLVAIVNESLARQHWPAGAVGARIRFPDMPVDRWVTIVGVVADHKWERMVEEPKPALYLPLGQGAPATMRLITRVGDIDLAAAGVAIRDAVRLVDPETPVDTVVSLDGLVRESASASRFLAVLFSGFGAVGLLLGALGIYGVTTEAMERSRHDIAVRLAIGADPDAIVRMVLKQGLALAVAGTGIGLVIAWFGSSALAGSLFGVSATDPATYALVTLLLLAVTAIAAYLPARRASRISPLESLRAS